MSSWMIPVCRQALRANSISVTALLVGLVLVTPIKAFAAPEISGGPDAVSIDAQHSSIQEILSELHQRFDVQFQSTANLDAPLTGTYQGPLRQIVARLLAGYNFVIITKQGGIEVTVLGNGPSTSTTTISSNAAAIGPGQAPTQPAQSSHLAPAAQSPTPAITQEQQPVAGDQSSSPMPLIKVAEGPSAVPTPSSVAGPTPGPATTSMPEPKPSGDMPMPTPSTVTMPSGNTNAPGNPGSTNPPSITPPAPATPAPQKP
jgi:hypothetical protein